MVQLKYTRTLVFKLSVETFFVLAFVEPRAPPKTAIFLFLGGNELMMAPLKSFVVEKVDIFVVAQVEQPNHKAHEVRKNTSESTDLDLSVAGEPASVVPG